MKLRDRIVRYYTRELAEGDGRTVFDLFKWTQREVLLKDYKSGRILCEMHDLEFPEAYSQQACDIIASKYFRKAGLPTPEGYERSMRQVADRMVRFWLTQLESEGILQTPEESEIVYDELCYMLLAQLIAPNSPQWFNTGLKQAYGIAGGHSELYYYDPAQGRVVMSEDDYTRTQASACFILSIEDKLLGENSISDHYVTETKLFKGGSGTGTNFSAIRAEGEGLSGGGCSSGLMSFLKGLDRNAGAIKSGGTTRRAAKMVCLDIDHPEIENFIAWKAQEEDKVMALAKMGYDADIDGEAYQTVSGQNSNNSVQISDAFMQKVARLAEEPEAGWMLKGRLDDQVNREVPVARLWENFNRSAWRCADPAPQFCDTFNAWHTCPAGEDGQLGARHNRINSTNPCGEYAFLDDTSCNLASINVNAFYQPERDFFDLEGYLHVIDFAQLFLEASIIGGQFPTPAIARKTWRFRSTGLGLANLASLLMARGLPYDSEEARALGATLAGLLTGRSYAFSALMAAEVGPFEAYELNREPMQRVIRNHARAAGARRDQPEGLGYQLPVLRHSLLVELGLGQLSEGLIRTWQEAEEWGGLYGYRNAQVSVMAPTGTISFAMDCAATSIEPFFSHVVYKKLSGGGYMKLVNPMVAQGLRKLGYAEETVQGILDYILREENGMILDGKIEGAPGLRDEDLAVFDTANTCGSGSRYIHYLGHVRMVAAITPLISGAISKTVNLPADATVEDFKEVVLESWRLGVKGITLYRDGSKFAQPLNRSLQADDAAGRPLADLSYAELLARAQDLEAALAVEAEAARIRTAGSKRDKLVGIRSGRTHPAQIEDIKIYTTVNRNAAGEISEIYITTDREGSLIMGLLNSLSKTISVMLQYRIPPRNIAKMLRGQKYEPAGFVSRHPYIKYVSSISDLISRIIDLEIGDYSRLQVKPEGLDDPAGSRAGASGEPLASPASTVLSANNPGDLGDLSQALGLSADEDEAAEEAAFDAQLSLNEFIHENARSAAAQGERLHDGSVCSNCSSTRLVRNGTCKVCLDCGSTTGCS